MLEQIRQLEDLGLVGLLLLAIVGFLAARVVPKGVVEQLLSEQAQAHQNVEAVLRDQISDMERRISTLEERERKIQNEILRLNRSSTEAISALKSAITDLRESKTTPPG